MKNPGMPMRSAGILMYKIVDGEPLVLLAHPGGPFWRKRDAGAWTIPKGELSPGEDAETAARREFREEVGIDPGNPLSPLGSIKQKSGKWVDAFAVEGDFDPAKLNSNTFEIEWPPRSGRMQSFPEIDKVQWMGRTQARAMIIPAQQALLDRLDQLIRKS